LQTIIGKSHPSLYSLIKHFQKEEADTAVMIAELDAGKKIRQQQRLKYRRINERIQVLARNYEQYKNEGRRVDYMKACGHNIGL
jgi:pyruvate/oxaloacetate carboxyltransferase